MTIDTTLIEPFKKLELIAKKAVEGFISGLHKSPFHGFSVEFAEHRLYNKGESTRHIDWKLFARSDKLFIKRYEEETNLRCQIVIDISSSMLFPKNEPNNKLNFCIYAAAALCELLKQQRDAYGLSLFDSEIIKHFSAKSNPQHKQLIFSTLSELLSKSELNKNTNALLALSQIAEIIHKRSLVFIFSDMFENIGNSDELFNALQHLKYKKHEVVLFNVTDKLKEVDFDFENKPYHFIDLESGQELKLNPNELKEAYVEKIKNHRDALQVKCGQYKIDLIDADINMGFNKILHTYLIKRAAML
ncbi:MAG: DUF58 domain-containing protein [Bacteroidetes bacterium]|nr:DUF58 domain-containing protein [Bacteroidota bacterium]